MERYRDLGAHFPHVYGANVPNPAMRFWKRFEYSVNFVDAGAGDVDYRGLVLPSFRMMVLGAYITSIDGDIAANAVAYETFNVENWGTAGTVIATLDTSTVGLTQYTPRAMTLSATFANLIIERGEVIEIEMVPTGGGVVINQCAVTLIVKAIE